MKQNFAESRRGFLKLTMASLGSVYFPLLSPTAFAKQLSDELDPHFFFQFLIPGGVDQTYFFDARPLDMKAKGLMQNYLNAEPAPWLSSDGISTLATSLVDPLKSFRQNFSVVNGIMMSSSFEGHDQNANLLLAGDPFGGESFIPHLNNVSARVSAPVDSLQSGSMFSNISNASKTVPLDASAMVNLTKQLTDVKASEAKLKSEAFVNSRYQNIGSGRGQFSDTAHQMQISFQGVPELSQKLINVKVDTTERDPDIAFFKVALELFKQGISRTAIFAVTDVGNIDVHAGSDCKKSPETYSKVVAKLVSLLQTLKTIPFDNKRSFMDVTTFMVASEFSRTMKQTEFDVDSTGTNHNPLNNSIIIGGKGIRPDLIVGASDRQSATEKVSGAHQTMDHESLRIIARPFDFKTGAVRTDLPENFKAEDYLGIGSVINTIYSQFGVSKDKYRIIARNAPVCPILNKILV